MPSVSIHSHWDNEAPSTVAFPLDDLQESTPKKNKRNDGARTLSDILRKHADREFAMDKEEEARVGDVLRGWINSSLSPYEPDDDTFTSFIAHKDDLCIPSSTKRKEERGRARGMSESARSSSSVASAA